MTKKTETELICVNPNGVYTVCVDEAETIWEFRDLVLEPLLLAMGYQPGTLDKLFVRDGEFGKELGALKKIRSKLKEYSSPYMIGDKFICNKGDKDIGVGEVFVVQECGDNRDLPDGNWVETCSLSDGCYINQVEVGDPYNITESEMDELFKGLKHNYMRIEN